MSTTYFMHILCSFKIFLALRNSIGDLLHLSVINKELADRQWIIESPGLRPLTSPAVILSRSLALRLVLMPMVNKAEFLGLSEISFFIALMSFFLLIGSTLICDPILGHRPKRQKARQCFRR